MLAMVEVIKKARAELESITGSEVERVYGVDKVDDGWHLRMEVVEVLRTPNTQDLLAMYEVDLAPDGAIAGLNRVGLRLRADAFTEERE
ncbi:MAG: gas vesicle protein [Actinomycetia bacterium]|nr:gas vesicle protein [Actinomycetes bacterium]